MFWEKGKGGGGRGYICFNRAHLSSICGKADEGRLAMQSQAESLCGERNWFRSPHGSLGEGLAGSWWRGTLTKVCSWDEIIYHEL